MRQSGEPSVEEILESIKKVIARDNRAPAQRRERDEENIATLRGPDAIDDDVLELGEVAEMTGDEADETPLLDEAARSSMRDSLAALAMLAEPGVPPQIVRSGETSLEGLARELLRPALAQWLEEHLPALVERMVAAEIARIVGKKG